VISTALTSKVFWNSNNKKFGNFRPARRFEIGQHNAAPNVGYSRRSPRKEYPMTTNNEQNKNQQNKNEQNKNQQNKNEQNKNEQSKNEQNRNDQNRNDK
jgi:Mg-chelatase subunit ChlI